MPSGSINAKLHVLYKVVCRVTQQRFYNIILSCENNDILFHLCVNLGCHLEYVNNFKFYLKS
jgi:hypothetical protein